MGLGWRRLISWKSSLPRTTSTPCAPCAVCSIRRTAAILTKCFPARNAAPTLRRRNKSPPEGRPWIEHFPKDSFPTLSSIFVETLCRSSVENGLIRQSVRQRFPTKTLRQGIWDKLQPGANGKDFPATARRNRAERIGNWPRRNRSGKLASRAPELYYGRSQQNRTMFP